MTTLILQMVHGQKLEQSKVEHLVDVLNTTIASDFEVKLEHNRIECSLNQFNKVLDIRHNNDIAQDSLTPKAKKELYHSGRYIGPAFWTYSFPTLKNSEVQFKATKTQNIFCTIYFKDLDTIAIKSKLNAFTSHHRTLDSKSHTVNWTGDKYISLLIRPKTIDDTIQLDIKGITISGKFERKDNKEIAKNYTKSLREILKREFRKLFLSKEIVHIVLETFKN